MKKEERKINGFTLWTRAGGKLAFAYQEEPTVGLVDKVDYESALRTPIIVGYEGEMGRPLDEVLVENRKMKEELEADAQSHLVSLINSIVTLAERVDRLEKPWWRRGN